jgi:hypothetical protein
MEKFDSKTPAGSPAPAARPSVIQETVERIPLAGRSAVQRLMTASQKVTTWVFGGPGLVKNVSPDRAPLEENSWERQRPDPRPFGGI